MKRIVKRLIVVSLMTGMICSTVFANGSGEKQKQYKLAISVDTRNEYKNLFIAAIENHPQVFDGTVKVVLFDGQNDMNKQLSDFETITSSGFDGIIMIPRDTEGGASAVKVAHDAGIPVIVANARVNSDLVRAHVISDDVKGGELETEALIKKMGDTGDIVQFRGPIGGSGEIDRGKGNAQVLSNYPNIHIIENQTANWNRAEALNIMEDWLTAHPNQIKGVLAQNDEMALGAMQAIKFAGLDVKDFAIVGIDGITDALNAVKADEMSSILQDAIAQAQASVDILLSDYIGKSYTPKAEVWKQIAWNDGKDNLYMIPWVLVTKENADTLLAQRKALTEK